MPTITVYKGSQTGKVVRHEVSAPQTAPVNRQVLVKITHSGLCGTDEHYKTQDMVLGHEGVGIVEAVGNAVRKLKLGDRVGWGYCHGSCMSCRECEEGHELYCSQRQLYGSTHLDQGSFASHALWDEDFLFHIPDSMPSAEAAPLMCAGAATYSALSAARVQWKDRVGVLGVGGLGHLAIQFAANMGCQVVALSHSSSKEADALGFGATEFHCLEGATQAGSLEPVDCLLLAGSRQPDWAMVIPLVRRGGVIVAMTVDTEDLRLPYMDLVMNAISIVGSLPASPRMHREMLQFAALHRVFPVIEGFPFTEDGVNDAMDKLRRGKMRYRGVLSREIQ